MRFDLNRLVYRRMHQALGTAFSPKTVLFPDRDDMFECGLPANIRLTGDVRFFNSKIQLNEPQRQAVISIVNRSTGMMPFVVFGPYVPPSLHQGLKLKSYTGPVLVKP